MRRSKKVSFAKKFGDPHKRIPSQERFELSRLNPTENLLFYLCLVEKSLLQKNSGTPTNVYIAKRTGGKGGRTEGHTYTHTHVHMYTRARVHTCIHAYTRIHMPTHKYTRMYTLVLKTSPWPGWLYSAALKLKLLRKFDKISVSVEVTFKLKKNSQLFSKSEPDAKNELWAAKVRTNLARVACERIELNFKQT